MRSEEYEHLSKAENRLWWFRAMRLFLARLLPPQPHGGASVLDIGCGTGGLLASLSSSAYRPIGLDFSAVALGYAGEKTNRGLVRASANHIPFKSAFDLVISVDVLEVGSVDPEKLAAGALRALKPGGHGLFVMAAHQWLLSEHDRAVNSVRRYNLSQMRSLFSASGARILRATYLFFLVFPLVALRKLINPSRKEDNRNPVSDVKIPPAVVNGPLYGICWLEAQLLSRLNMPIGSSVAVLVKKDG
ncbi:MAG: class I SAM-dependent methyltransferase [Anaerolineales bacterium]